LSGGLEMIKIHRAVTPDSSPSMLVANIVGGELFFVAIKLFAAYKDSR
jgi:hypothetical protein